MSKIEYAKAAPLSGRMALARCLSVRWVGLFLLLVLLPAGWAQFAPLKVIRIAIKHIGPPAASDELIRSNLRVKVGDLYLRAAVDDDVRNLYATGFFYNIQVDADNTPDGVVLTYSVQGKPRLTEIKFHGNTKFTAAKLLKKISSKVDAPLDERKLFTDTQDIQKLTRRRATSARRSNTCWAFSERWAAAPLRSRSARLPRSRSWRWISSAPRRFRSRSSARPSRLASTGCSPWITGSGVLKDEQFEEDKDRLTEALSGEGLHRLRNQGCQVLESDAPDHDHPVYSLRGHPIPGGLG